MIERIASRAQGRRNLARTWYSVRTSTIGDGACSHALRKRSTTVRSIQNVATSQDQRPPLFRVERAIIPGLKSPAPHEHSSLSISIEDAAEREAWAIIGPAAEQGGAVKAEVVKAILGLTRVRVRSPQGHVIHETKSHPYLQGSPISPTQSLRLVSFSARLSSVGSGSSNSFVDFSARYGAIREEDRVTLWEDLLRDMGTKTGLVARLALANDPLADPEEEKKRDYEEGGVNRLPWRSEEAQRQARTKAQKDAARIHELAPLLNLSQGDPPFLQRPLIALSNGQTRRARILSALCSGCDVLVLEEPFTGLDPPTRQSLSQLLGELHSKRQPRVICVLREQDKLPAFVTHVLSIGEGGEIAYQGPVSGRDTGKPTVPNTKNISNTSHPKGGYESLQRSRDLGKGRGDETAEPVVRMQDVSIAYKGKKVLDSVSLHLPPGSTTILVGDNGSGKTTLLSLLLGAHPQSFAIPSASLLLFGKARSEPANATPLLLRKTGQLSPELANAFPRRSIERGGLTVAEAVGTGFEGIFTRRPLASEQEARVFHLVKSFARVLSSGSSVSRGTESLGATASDKSKGEEPSKENMDRFLSSAFSSLTPGSQAVILFLRSIVHRPRLLILDEPFQGMSAAQVDSVRRYLDEHGSQPSPSSNATEEAEHDKDVQWRKERAIVVVSHFEDEWPVEAGRLIRLAEGKVVEQI